jgi:hypothetical protein
MSTNTKSLSVELAFSVLEKAANEGRRCPTNPELSAELGKRGIDLAAQSMPKAE